MLLAVFKAIIGAVSKSIAITLDAVNNLSDAVSSVVTIIGAKLGEVRQIANELRKYPSRFYTCHCTGIAAYEEMKSIMGEQLQYIHSGDEIY